MDSLATSFTLRLNYRSRRRRTPPSTLLMMQHSADHSPGHPGSDYDTLAQRVGC